MSDFFEIDFINMESSKSGDAISLRYQLNGNTYIHVVDGGYLDTGEDLVKHIKQYYDNPTCIHNVVVTHPDQDHANGLTKILEEFEIGTLWMLRPWLYANEMIDRFSRFTSVDNLKKRLREIYPSIDTLEELALENKITISEPFQGARIGEFIVLAPTKSRYLDLIVESDKTPESTKEEQQARIASFRSLVERAAVKFIRLIKAAWGIETFSKEETSPENDMSIIQYAKLCEKNILLTGDAGRSALTEAADYAPYVGLTLPGIDHFQVPHHGSRRNVSTETLDRLLGPKLVSKPEKGDETFTAIISTSQKDTDHPRKAVVRAVIHRGAGIVTNQEADLVIIRNAPHREGWSAAKKLPYPDEQEE